MEDVIIMSGYIWCVKKVVESLCDGVRAWFTCTLSLPWIGCESISPPSWAEVVATV